MSVLAITLPAGIGFAPIIERKVAGQVVERRPMQFIARCGECGRARNDPTAGIACRGDCPLRHNRSDR